MTCDQGTTLRPTEPQPWLIVAALGQKSPTIPSGPDNVEREGTGLLDIIQVTTRIYSVESTILLIDGRPLKKIYIH